MKIKEILRKTVENNKYLKSIGVELECGTNIANYKSLLKKYSGIINDFIESSDGSVYVSNKDFTNVELKYWFYIENLEKAYEFEKKLWNILEIEQNESCGNHIHIRLKDFNLYYELISKDFIQYFINQYFNFIHKNKLDFSKYYRRLQNNYCRFVDNIILFIEYNLERWNRYYFMNFVSLSEYQKTLEFRIMPYATDAKEHFLQIAFIVNVVNDYLDKVTRKDVIKEYILKEELNTDRIVLRI